METAEPTPLFPLESDLRVLIVEDSKIEAKLTANLLKKNGYNVVHKRVETEEAGPNQRIIAARYAGESRQVGDEQSSETV